MQMGEGYRVRYDPLHKEIKLMRLGLSDVVGEEVLILLEMEKYEKHG